MSMTIRVKRKRQVIFLFVKKSTSFGEIKNTLRELAMGAKDAHGIKLMSRNKATTYEDAATIGDQDIRDNAQILMVYQRKDGSFEKVNLAEDKPDASSKKK